MSASSRSLKRAIQLFDVLTKGRHFDNVFSTFRVVAATPMTVKAEYTVLDIHTNKYGTLHGGFTSTAFDILTTLALMTDENDSRPGVSLNLSVNYLKALKVGETVTFEGEVVRKGKSVAYTTASVFNEKGDLAAHGTHIKHLGN